MMDHSLINPNQLRAFDIPVHDNPYDLKKFGIEADECFIPLRSQGTVVSFESRVPMDWEERNLPVILLTADRWDPANVDMSAGCRTREQAEMKTIRSLTSGMTQRQIGEMRKVKAESRAVEWGEVEEHLNHISPAYNLTTFCDCLIGAVRVACTYRKDVDELEETRKASSVKSNDRHSKVSPKELARKWNIGLETARDTMNVTTQQGVTTATQPLSRRLRVDHLDLHRKRLKGTWFADTLIAKVKSILGNVLAERNVDFQLTPAGIHRRNAAERAIRTWKNHMIANLCGTDPDFPLELWDKLLPQLQMTLNLLRKSRVNPQLSAYAQLEGAFNFNQTPLAPVGTKVIIHEKPHERPTWSTHGVDGW